ncbi:hypothetical protein [Streptomyces sp. NPDC002088]|uniref:hypothetical protein n=1 Tax=Streptomyces sp. NPDC002088 TaxID=3154665 RepID=UPI003330283A
MTGIPALSNRLHDGVLALPSGPLVEASLAAARAAVHPSVLNHCIRGFYWSRLFAAHKGVLNDAEYNEELLFAANVLHDLGTGPDAPGLLRFEIESADLAAALLTAWAGDGTPSSGTLGPSAGRTWPRAICANSPTNSPRSSPIWHIRGLKPTGR